MVLAELPEQVVDVVEAGALQIRQLAQDVLGHAETALLQMRNIARQVGINELRAALADDAASLAVVYSALKSAVEAGKETTVADL